MIVERLDVWPCILPKEDPTWRFALAANPETRGWVVRITTDTGANGYGYASAVEHMGTAFEGLGATVERLGSVVRGMNPLDIAAVHTALDGRMGGNNMAKSGIDGALYDLLATHLDVPLYRVLGGKCRDEVPLMRLLAIKAPAEMAAKAQELVDEGYGYLKIKVKGDPVEDAERVAAIRTQVGWGVHLTIDANQSYSPKAAIQAIALMQDSRIDLVEQPVRADDLKGLALVTQSTAVDIEADESAGSVSEILNLVTSRIVDRVSLKVPKLGGLYRTLQAAAICDAARVPYRLGGAVGSRLSSAGALHLAAALPGVDYACELAEYERLLNDPFEGLPVVNGALRVPDGPGLGVRLREPALA